MDRNLSPRRFGAASTAAPSEADSFLHDPVGCMRLLQRKHGNLVEFIRGQGRVIFAFGEEYNRDLYTNLDTFHIVSRFPGPRKSAQRRFGQGLFSQNGSEHTTFRRLLMPPFSKGALGSYQVALLSLTRELIADWKPGQTHDLVQEMKELTLRITARLLFGVADLSIAHAIEGLFEEWLDLNHVVSFAAQLPVESPPGCYEELIEVAERLEAQLQALVREKRQRPLPGRDLLAILLAARDEGIMTDSEVIAQTITLFNAAYHTTTYALTWALFLVVQHPEVMRPLHDELRTTLHGGVPSMDQLSEMSLLDRVIKESLRMLPPVVYTPRISTRPATLGSHPVREGTLVLASPYISGHLPEAFPEPERFMPDRWLEGAISVWANIPFGAGSRMCLGAPFATMVVKLVLSVILQRFRLQVEPGACIERHGSLTLGAKFGVPVRLFEQDRQFETSPVTGTIHEMVDLPEIGRPATRAA